MAKFYGIGVGPGDSELVTVKASRLLEDLDILYTPEAKKGSKSFALGIAEPYLKEHLEIKQRHFPMVRSNSTKEVQWQAISVKSGKNVGFITLGDPMVYSTYSYLLALLEKEIDCQTIPGITSFCSMASELGQPLTMDEESLAVMPATASAEKIEAALELHDSIVLMKVANHLDTVLPLLEKLGLLQQTFMVSNSSTDKQQTLLGLEGITPETKLPYFTTFLVKKKIF